MAAYNIEQIKDKKKLVKLANYGTAERRNMRPKVLIGAGEEKPFIEGDILDANATQNLIEDTYNKGRIFRSFSKEGKKIDKEIKELLEKTNENYEQLSSAIADNKEDADQKIDQLSSKVDNIESNIPNLRRVVDIQLQSVLDGTKTYLVTKQGDVQEEMQISDGEKGEQGEKGDPFTYEDFTPEQIEGLKVKGDRGVSISSLEQTQVAYTSGGVNEFTITLDDGTVSRWYVRNGQKGDATKIWVNANTVHSGYYDSDNHEIKLLNADGGIMSIIDATAFIKDGMISDAYVEDGYIVIVFNTDSGKTPIMIPVTDIFDADDYYTKLDTDARIAEDVLVETQRAEAAEQQLTDNLAQEVSDRQSGDTTLNTKIETETTRATNAEEALSDAIDAEESTRIQEIDDLQDLLDAYIQSNNAAVQAEVSRATAAEQTNATAIATESSRAQSAEQNLQNDIDSEVQRATAAEQGLQTAIDELEQSAGQGITEVQQVLSDEITRATGAESQLSADLSAEITRATNADNANATAISNEVARATLSEQQNATDIDAIEALIPSQATSENQLADKAFVNSSIATSTATFVGTFNSITDLYAVTTADVNDYGYVVTTDSVGNTKYNRYKYDGSQWDFEYSLNNSSFTAEEWASIQSGMTQALREKLESLPSSATTSIGISVPTGFTVTGSPVVSSGTIAINFEDGYSIPTITSQTNWDTAYGWGNHANAGYVKQVKVGTDAYSPTGGIVSLPAYPTSLPASDVYSWAKASTKPSYTLDEISDGGSRKLANYLPLSGGTIIRDTNDDIPLYLQSGGSQPDCYLGYSNYAGTLLGYIGYNSDAKPMLYYNTGEYEIWHKGNLTDNSQLTNGAGYVTSSGSVNYAASAGNADTVDGLHASDFGRIYIHNGEWSTSDAIPNNLADGFHAIHVPGIEYSSILSGHDFGGSNWQLYFHPDLYYTDEVFYRKPSKGVIRQFAFIDSNVASATKLQTPHSLWGQSFDGTLDLTGRLTIQSDIRCVPTDSSYEVFQFGALNNDTYTGYIYGETNSYYLVFRGGNTGVGISPSHKLDINGDELIRGQLYINSTNAEQDINFLKNGVFRYQLCAHDNNFIFYRNNGSWNADVLWNYNTGGWIFSQQVYFNRGGENTPSIRWNKDGTYWGGIGYGGTRNENVFGPVDTNGNWVTLTSPDTWTFRGDVKGYNFYTTSDKSKKQNISELSEHIRKFQLKDTEKWHYGVIALEVPEMFRKGEEGSYTVNYNSILSYYIGLLENRVAELENKVKELSHG